MKFEGMCVNRDCPTYVDNPNTGRKSHQFQVLTAARFVPHQLSALDEDGQEVRCPKCKSVTRFVRQTRDDAQLPVGMVVADDGVKALFDMGEGDWRTPLEKYIVRHAAGEPGSLRKKPKDGEEFRSRWDHDGVIFELTTDKLRRHTYATLNEQQPQE